MIHIVALAPRPLVITLRDTIYAISKITHDNGELSEFVCDPPCDELEQLVAANLKFHRGLGLKDLHDSVKRASLRPKRGDTTDR